MWYRQLGKKREIFGIGKSGCLADSEETNDEFTDSTQDVSLPSLEHTNDTSKLLYMDTNEEISHISFFFINSRD